MEKRSWPWKRKLTDKTASSNDASPVSSPGQSKRQSEEHVSLGLSQFSNSTATLPEEHENKLKDLNHKLTAAMLETASQEALSKQHIKIAEEAVSGWEKMQNEAIMLKQQLEKALEQKLAAEERVFHLEGALKESVWELRYTREEQESKIHKAILKHTQEWDTHRTELEDKLAHAQQRNLEKDAHITSITKALQEQAKKFSQASHACTQAHADSSLLRLKLESVEKENVALKYELNVSNKELEIRNQEKVMNERALEAASKQHSQTVGKIAKLEAECTRLRSLLRKRLLGRSTIAQIRSEIEQSEQRNNHHVGSQKALQSQHDEEFNLLSERLQASEEETRMLRERLAKRSTELQSAKHIRVHTARKSNVQGQVHSPKGLDSHVYDIKSFAYTKDSSPMSTSEDGLDKVSCSESWASVAIGELDEIKTAKLPQSPQDTLNASKLDIMDDFAEMERLASLSPGHSHMTSERVITSCLKAQPKSQEVGSELTSIVCKIVRAVEDLAMPSNGAPIFSKGEIFAHDDDDPLTVKRQSNNTMLNDEMQKLISSANKFLHGEEDLLSFLTELSLMLNCLSKASAKVSPLSAFTDCTASNDCVQAVGLYDSISSISLTSKASMPQSMTKEATKTVQLEGQDLRLQLHEAKHFVESLQTELAAVKSSKRQTEEQLEILKAQTDRQAQGNVITLNYLRGKIQRLENDLSMKHEKVGEFESECEELRVQLITHSICSLCGCQADQARKNTQEQDIAKKLAECQQTILALGNQLKTLSAKKPLNHADLPTCGINMENFVSMTASSIESGVTHSKSMHCKKSRVLYNHNIIDDKKQVNFQNRFTLDMEDSELVSLARGMFEGSGNYDSNDGRNPYQRGRHLQHKDYIDAVLEQMPSSPELASSPVKSAKGIECT